MRVCKFSAVTNTAITKSRNPFDAFRNGNEERSLSKTSAPQVWRHAERH